MVLAVADKTQTTCVRCGDALPEEQVLSHRQFCDDCRIVNRKEYDASPKRKATHKASDAKREATPEVRVRRRLATARRQATLQGRVAHIRCQARYAHSPEGKIYYKAYLADYFKSPEGMAARAKGTATRRERSTDPELFAARVELLHILREPCTICGAPYHRSHQIDHILALCNGGIDEWDNYHPLCFECHQVKTAEDLRLFWGSKVSKINRG